MTISVAMLSMAAAWKRSSRRNCRAQKGSSCVSTRTMKEHDTMKEPAGKTKRVLRLAASTFMPSSSGVLVLGVVAQLGNRRSFRSTEPHSPVQENGPFTIFRSLRLHVNQSSGSFVLLSLDRSWTLSHLHPWRFDAGDLVGLLGLVHRLPC